MSITILHPKDIAERLGMSPRWVYNHYAELGGVKIGKRVFFTEEGFEEVFEKALQERVPMRYLPRHVPQPKGDRRVGGGKKKSSSDRDEADDDRYGIWRILREKQ